MDADHAAAAASKRHAEDEDDTPLAKRQVKAELDDDDVPLAAKKKPASPKKPAAANGGHAAADDDDKPLSLLKRPAAAAASTNGSATPASANKKKEPIKIKKEPEQPPAKIKKEEGTPVKVKKEEASPAKSKSVTKVKAEPPATPKAAKSASAASSAKKKKDEEEEEDDDYDEEDEDDEDDDEEDDGEDEDDEDDDEEADDDDDEAAKRKKKKAAAADKKKTPTKASKNKSDAEDDEAAARKKAKKERKKKEAEEEEIHRWWEEEELPDGQKWRTLEHNGPCFPPLYEPLPKHVEFFYDGKPFALSPEAEEVAGFYAKMLSRDYVTKDVFNKNFMADWRSVMTKEERGIITDLKKCDFTRIKTYFDERSEARKNATKEEKAKLKEEKEAMRQKYGYALMDGRKVAIANWTIEPPGLFQGRGQHPKMGMLKRRVVPEQIIINCSAGARVPDPPSGHRWKEVRHDNTVTWLAGWKENVQDQNKYVQLAAETHIKGRSDWKKYETARELKKHVNKIRKDYTEDLKSSAMADRQRATALYFIDKLALRAGGEKDADEEADTVGCCSLRVEHLTLLENDTLKFDFLGKDSIRYYNEVKVDHQVWKNIGHFKKNKEAGDELFDRLSSPMLNDYLKTLMPNLTAKVFRTYNASITLQEQLKNTPVNGTVEERMLAYERANRAVAVLCNHQRAAPKTHDQQVTKLDDELKKIRDELAQVKKDRKDLKARARAEGPTATDLKKLESMKKKIETLEIRLQKKEIAKVNKIENATVALSTSKLNYLDPRISVAWAMRNQVPIEKVYNATQRKKFRWAIEMTKEDYVF